MLWNFVLANKYFANMFFGGGGGEYKIKVTSGTSNQVLL